MKLWKSLFSVLALSAVSACEQPYQISVQSAAQATVADGPTESGGESQQSPPSSSSPVPAPKVNCTGYWTGWSACSAGTQNQSFVVTTPAANGGVACPAVRTRSQSCVVPPPPVNCAGSWPSSWSTCTNGVQSKTYLVTTTPANGGSACPAPQTRDCPLDCPSWPTGEYPTTQSACDNTTIYPDSVGAGTEANPYKICNVKQFYSLAVRKYLASSPGRFYQLTQDINVASCFQGGIAFRGQFDGNNHVLSEATKTPFSSNQGVIKNLGVVNIRIQKTGLGGGGLADSNWGQITNSYTTGTLTATCTGSGYAGGLVGSTSGGIFVGHPPSISNSSSSVEVHLHNCVGGGLVGIATQARIANSHSTGAVTIEDYSTYFNHSADIGGLAGSAVQGIITNSYATGAVAVTSSGTGSVLAGGLVGEGTQGTFTNSYATGAVAVTSSGTGSVLAGGLVGNDTQATITNAFFDMNSSGMSAGSGTTYCMNYIAARGLCGVGKTTAEMKTPTTFASWDTSIWNLVAGQYPTLK